MFKKMKHMKNEKGLTLIELLAVIVILAIIAAIAIPAIGNIINNSRDKAILSEASNILSGAKLAHIDNACGAPSGSVVTCDSTELKNYVDGITLTSADSVQFDASTGASAGWSITYSKFANIKDQTKFGAGITSNKISENQLNTNLTK